MMGQASLSKMTWITVRKEFFGTFECWWLVFLLPSKDRSNGLVMNGVTKLRWFELIASLICSNRRGEVPLEVGS